MPLDQTCTNFVGKNLIAKPLHGWAWRREAEALDPDRFAPIDTPGGITFRVSELLDWRGDLRHLIGRVDTQHFLLGGLWITDAVMQTGIFDFRDRLCLRYDLSCAPLPPTGEWPLARGTLRWEGYGVVAESEEIIDAYLAALQKGI